MWYLLADRAVYSADIPGYIEGLRRGQSRRKYVVAGLLLLCYPAGCSVQEGDIAMTHDAWLSFAYQFVIGGMLFAVPIAAGLKFQVIRLDRPIDHRLMLSIVGIFLFYFVLQGLWTLIVLV